MTDNTEAARLDILRDSSRKQVRLVAGFMLGAVLSGANLPTATLVAALTMTANLLWYTQITGSWSCGAGHWMRRTVSSMVILHTTLIALPCLLLDESVLWYDRPTMFLGIMILWTASLFILPGMLDRLKKESPVTG